MAEAWQLFKQWCFVRSSIFFDICLERDTLQIVKECTTKSSNMSRYGHLVEGIKSSIQSFQMTNLVQVKQEVNSTVHGLAWEVVTHNVDTIWMEEIPPRIYNIVLRKLIVLMFWSKLLLRFILIRMEFVKKKGRRFGGRKVCLTKENMSKMNNLRKILLNPPRLL
jgi:hypothetical protein